MGVRIPTLKELEYRIHAEHRGNEDHRLARHSSLPCPANVKYGGIPDTFLRLYRRVGGCF